MVVVVEGCPIRRWATLEWMLNKTRKVPSERPEVLEVVGRHLRALHERLPRAGEDVPSAVRGSDRGREYVAAFFSQRAERQTFLRLLPLSA
jgi:hypothetical protein